MTGNSLLVSVGTNLGIRGELDCRRGGNVDAGYYHLQQCLLSESVRI